VIPLAFEAKDVKCASYYPGEGFESLATYLV